MSRRAGGMRRNVAAGSTPPPVRRADGLWAHTALGRIARMPSKWSFFAVNSQEAGREAARVGRARVYLCAPFAQRFEMRSVRLVLEARGLRVRSRWIDAEADAAALEAQAAAALECLEDVARADVIVAFTTGPAAWQTGGRHVEFGYALATHKPVFLVGPRENVFHAIPWVRGPFAGVEELLEALA